MEISLESILHEKGKYNLALPFVQSQQINPYLKLSVSVIEVDTSDQSGDIYKYGQKPVRKGDKEVWIDTYSLTKSFLHRLATEAGIQFNPGAGDVIRIDENTWKSSASGAVKLPDGTVRTSTNFKVIDLISEERKYRLNYEDKAENGIEDFRAAKDASMKYEGKWQDTGRKNEKNYPIKLFVIEPKDREKYIERCLIDAMAQLRANAPQKAATGAILRVIRDLIGIKGSYPLEELKKPFVVARMSFSPDYNDPMVKQMVLQQCIQSMGNLFGLPPVVQTISAPVRDEEETEVIEENWLDMPEKQEQKLEPEMYPEEPEIRVNDLQCDKCGSIIPKRVWDYSYEKYGRPLCYKCQQIVRNDERGGIR